MEFDANIEHLRMAFWQVIITSGPILGIALGVGKDVNARIDERADKSYATQVYYCMSIGATRMEEEKVVEVQAHEA